MTDTTTPEEKNTPQSSAPEKSKTGAKSSKKAKNSDNSTDKKIIKRVNKKQVIADHKTHDKDTGSAPVQIAILTERIAYLTEHLKIHKKDDHSRRGLLQMVGKRKKLMKYMKESTPQEYTALIEKLGIRG